ncbi:thiamine phosphate synthase [Psychromarinibacter sp. S121]|uniref:thiamine phosphate synthase n=1 Tax=Psychromarinibacter sp. S121 TaxID=3415127 RepID=UPI003C7AE180
MAETEQPQIYLITPGDVELSTFPGLLAGVLDAVPVACLRLALTSNDEDRLLRAGDALREVAHARDVPIVIDRHWQLAERLGLDGVHLLDGARQIRAARKVLGEDAIVGAFCGTSRHDGMSAGEAGADYVGFGPCAPTALGDGSFAEPELFGWWSEMIEVPVVAEGGLTPELVTALAPLTDFFGMGPEIWDAEDPTAALKALAAAIL